MYINIHTHHLSNNCTCIVNSQPLQVHTHNLYSIGIHPWYVHHVDSDFEILKQKSIHQNCIAIGECGLDKLHKSTWETQLYIFAKQIQLANTICKPIIIHCVKASNEIIKTLIAHENKMPVIIHGFNQNNNILASFLHHNFYISIGASILISGSNSQLLINKIPIEKLFLETDNNEECDIQLIYEKVAILKNISVHRLQMQLQTNFNTIFAPR